MQKEKKSGKLKIKKVNSLKNCCQLSDNKNSVKRKEI